VRPKEVYWIVYIIECKSGAYYTGSTNDLGKRFDLHREGKGARYTRMDKPKRIVAAQICDSRSAALKLEGAVKALARSDKKKWVKANSYRLVCKR
jgi:putative endonuclease